MSEHYNGAYNKQYDVGGGPGRPILDVQAMRVSAEPYAQLHSSLLLSLWNKAGQDPSADLEVGFQGLAAIEANEIRRKAQGLGSTCLRDIHERLGRVVDSPLGMLGNIRNRLWGHWDVLFAADIGVTTEPSAVEQLGVALALPEGHDIATYASRAVALKVGETSESGYERMMTMLREAVERSDPDAGLTNELRGMGDVLAASRIVGLPELPTAP